MTSGLIASAAFLGIFSELQAEDPSVYEWVSTELSWSDAQADAARRGGWIATITSAAEWQRIQASGVLAANTRLLSFWLGGTDEGSEGQWRWTTGEPWTYSRWRSGEPNNADGAENYLISTHDGLWNDHPRRNLHPYLLERPDTSIRRATARVILVNGFVVGVEILDGGYGYEVAPKVTFVSDTGTGAVAEAEVVNGKVSQIRVRSAGCCYESLPQVVIASPPQTPSLAMEVSRVKLKASVTTGRRYSIQQQIESGTWVNLGDVFTANGDSHEVEVEVADGWKLYRIVEVP